MLAARNASAIGRVGHVVTVCATVRRAAAPPTRAADRIESVVARPAGREEDDVVTAGGEHLRDTRPMLPAAPVMNDLVADVTALPPQCRPSCCAPDGTAPQPAVAC